MLREKWDQSSSSKRTEWTRLMMGWGFPAFLTLAGGNEPEAGWSSTQLVRGVISIATSRYCR